MFLVSNNMGNRWCSPQVAIKSISLPTLDENEKIIKTALSREEKINAKHGALWECIDCVPNEFGGEIYTFKLKDIYNPYSPKYSSEAEGPELFPAIEPELTFCNYIFGSKEEANKILETVGKEYIEKFGDIRLYSDDLKFLGYNFKTNEDGAVLMLPDREALLSNWKNLRKVRDLPKLSVLSSEGIADDLSFVKAYIYHDALLSTGKEFVHDHTIHILSTITKILTEKSLYADKQSKMVAEISKNLQKITIAKNQLKQNILTIESEKLDKLKQFFPVIEAYLGSFVDTITATSWFADFSISDYQPLFGGNVHQYEYFVRRFPDLQTELLKSSNSSNCDSTYCLEQFSIFLKDLWNTVNAIEKEFHEQLQCDAIKV